MKTTPTFTCDHCSTPVGLHDTRCPSCGKTFEAVRCPRCGHQGPPRTFASGCPSCLYLAPTPPRTPPARRPLFGPVMAVLVGLLVVGVVISWALRAG